MMRTWAVLAMTLIAAGCGGDKKTGPTGPVPGDLTVSYSGPGTTDGALLLLVNGAGTTVTPLRGLQVASAKIGETQTRVVVTGNLSNGDLFEIAVPDVAQVGSYSVQIEAVADRNTFALKDPLAYSASIRR